MKGRAFLTLGFFFLLLAPSAFSAPEEPPEASSAEEILGLLGEIYQQYGADAVTLLGWLLDATVRSGSLLTASIKVEGMERHQKHAFLAFRVETGLIFNTLALDRNGRLNALWQKILVPTFAQLDTLAIPADGVLIHFLYHHRPYQNAEELRRSLDHVGTPEEARFYFLRRDLESYFKKSLSAQDLIQQSLITVNGLPAKFLLFPASPNGPSP